MIEALPQVLLDLGQVSVLEPDLEQAKSRLKCLGLRGSRDLRAQEQLLDVTSNCADYVRDVLLGKLLLSSVFDTELGSLLEQLREHFVAKLAMEQEFLVGLRLLLLLGSCDWLALLQSLLLGDVQSTELL